MYYFLISSHHNIIIMRLRVILIAFNCCFCKTSKKQKLINGIGIFYIRKTRWAIQQNIDNIM